MAVATFAPGGPAGGDVAERFDRATGRLSGAGIQRALRLRRVEVRPCGRRRLGRVSAWPLPAA